MYLLSSELQKAQDLSLKSGASSVATSRLAVDESSVSHYFRQLIVGQSTHVVNVFFSTNIDFSGITLPLFSLQQLFPSLSISNHEAASRISCE